MELEAMGLITEEEIESIGEGETQIRDAAEVSSATAGAAAGGGAAAGSAAGASAAHL